MKIQLVTRMAVSAIVAAGLMLSTAGVSVAAERPNDGIDFDPESPMSSSGVSVAYVESALELKGFDVAVAEANGYQIVTEADGTQRSIPVSAEAIAFETSRAAELASANRTTVTGNCGTSFVGVTRYGNRIMVGTGYSVFYPVVARLWVVQIYSFEGIPSFTWTGSSGANWNSAASFFMTAGGVASVTPGSSVVTQNGAVCWSGAPSEGF